MKRGHLGRGRVYRFAVYFEERQPLSLSVTVEQAGPYSLTLWSTICFWG